MYSDDSFVSCLGWVCLVRNFIIYLNQLNIGKVNFDFA